jgi:hypothetical protein
MRISKTNRQHSGQNKKYKRTNNDLPTTQWSKEKVQKDRQRPTKHTHKTKDRVTRTTLKTYT